MCHSEEEVKNHTDISVVKQIKSELINVYIGFTNNNYIR